jgi:hypothetical protein
MAGFPAEYVEWYFSEIARTVARRLRVREWEVRSHQELLEEIEKLRPEIRREIESFSKIYHEWAAATHSHETDSQYLIPLIQRREAGLEALVKAVAAAG